MPLYSTFRFLQKWARFDKWVEKCRIVVLYIQRGRPETMTQRLKWPVLMALVLVLATLVACRATSQETPAASPAEQIEEFTEETLTQYQGKVVVLNFWATWCPPCRAEMPALEAVYQEYRDRGVVIVAVNVVESSKAILRFVNELGLTFPVLRDSERKAGNRYGILFLPTTLFIGRDGQIAFREEGKIDQDTLSEKLDELLQ